MVRPSGHDDVARMNAVSFMLQSCKLQVERRPSPNLEPVTLNL